MVIGHIVVLPACAVGKTGEHESPEVCADLQHSVKCVT